jgi:hypothetical protein
MAERQINVSAALAINNHRKIDLSLHQIWKLLIDVFPKECEHLMDL